MTRPGPGGRAALAALAPVVLALASACGGVPLPRARVIEPAQPPEAFDPVALESFLRARLYAEHGYWEQAADQLRRAIRADSDAPTLRLALGEALAHVPESIDEGLMACRLALDLEAPAGEVALCRARLFEAADDPDAAAGVYRSLPPEAADPHVFEHWIRVASKLGDDAAVEAARAYATAFPADAAAWRALGDALADVAPVEAADAYGWAVRLPDPDPRDAYRRISLLVDAGRWDEALATAVDCRERFWEYWPCSSWQAVLLDRDRPEDAPIDPATEDALRHLAFMVSVDARQLGQSGAELAAEGGSELVVAYARIVAETRPDNVSVLTSAAWMANNVAAYDVAVEIMERVLAVDDANFDALNYIGYTWAEQGRNLERAEEYIRRALFLRGDDGNILDSLAWVQFRMGRFDEALETQLRAIELVADNAVLWDHLGDIYHALGRTSDAIDAWSRALEFADELDEDVLDDAPRKIREAGGAV